MENRIKDCNRIGSELYKKADNGTKNELRLMINSMITYRIKDLLEKLIEICLMSGVDCKILINSMSENEDMQKKLCNFVLNAYLGEKAENK